MLQYWIGEPEYMHNAPMFQMKILSLTDDDLGGCPTTKPTQIRAQPIQSARTPFLLSKKKWNQTVITEQHGI